MEETRIPIPMASGGNRNTETEMPNSVRDGAIG